MLMVRSFGFLYWSKTDQLIGNGPSINSSAALAVSKHERFDCLKKEKGDGELKKPEVRYDPHISRQNVILILSQKGKGQRDPEREKEGNGDKEFKEVSEVRRDLTSSNGSPLRPRRRRKKDPKSLNLRLGNTRKSLRYVVVPTPPQRDVIPTLLQKGKGPEHGGEEKGVNETAKKAKETLKEEVPRPTESAIASSVQNQNEVIPPPVTRRPSQDGRNDNYENVRPMAGPSNPVNTTNPSTANDRYDQGGKNQNLAQYNKSSASVRLLHRDRRANDSESPEIGRAHV